MKARGQHFLTDRRILGRIVDACDLNGSETVIEIGPGLGALTERLAEKAARVVAIEIDASLAVRLQERLAARRNVSIFEADALNASPQELLAGGHEYVLAGNLPYNAGLAIVRHFLESDAPPLRAIVMLQKEVADNLVAGPGRMSMAAVGVQVYATTRRLFDVGPSAFYPQPRVRSTVIRLDKLPEPLVPKPEQEAFFEIVRAGFSAPRKQLRNSLAQGLRLRSAWKREDPDAAEAILSRAAVDPDLRPADLSIADWFRLKRAGETQ